VRIVAINGSPRGRAGCTDVLVRALLDAAAMEGAETETVHLAERSIGPCRGCHSCWSTGRCVIDDDMPGVLARMAGASLIVLASPVHFANVSGTLKVFIDRLTAAGGDPRAASGAGTRKDGAASDPGPATGERRPPQPAAPPRLAMASSCGFPGTGQFDVISLWIHRLAAMMGTSVAVEAYATQGAALLAAEGKRGVETDRLLAAVAEAGRILARGGVLSEQQLGFLRGAA
jgi:multimeric flavodoxin WrbA